MRFVQGGPDIPAELVAAQEKGNTIFICGAGVSHPAGLPLFRELVEGVYQWLGEDWNLHTAEREGMTPDGRLSGQYDRVLRSLERRLLTTSAGRQNRGMRERVRAAVRHVLTPRDDADLSNHLALLQLSRDAEGRVRLLTTNFDTLFERAWFNEHQSSIPTHAGPAMPQPKVAGCIGILHLHGRLGDPWPQLHASETDLVLTSAEFGDAYLRSGWASRYVYDLVRAYVVVLVGYQADDPPMRYLLEALEADRERYPDLQKVYAFAPCERGEEDIVRALWEAKGVEPILYAAQNHDHELLYASLREWRRYAETPTAWRREQLQGSLSQPPSVLSEDKITEGVDLLGHGDALQLLAELSPSAAWLPIFAERRVFEKAEGMPGAWIASRIADPEMIRACAGLNELDEQARWQIDDTIRRRENTLSPVRRKAWQLILSAKRSRNRPEIIDSWYLQAPYIRRGEGGFGALRLIGRLLRPRFKVHRPIRWREEPAHAPEALHHLLRFDFNPSEHPSAKDILENWPQILESELALFRVLARTMLDALEEAEDTGYLNDIDRASMNVPSVADHPQNEYRSGFYPITRVLADLWLRIVSRDPLGARSLALAWGGSRFLLLRRLFLFAVAHEAFPPDSAANSIYELDDVTFWHSDAQVEIMRGLVNRWGEFDGTQRERIETRLRKGISRSLYPKDAFEDEEEWESVRDASIYRRLERIRVAGGAVTPASEGLLLEIAARHPRWQHPQWQPQADDRDDFRAWHETRWGPSGHPELLAGVADDRLVVEAVRLQREQYLQEGDVWRVFCSSDPDRAFRGLLTEADQGRWDAEAWRSLLWAATEKGDADFQIAVADQLLRIPSNDLNEILPTAASWFRTRRDLLSTSDRPDGSRFLSLWDRLADLTFVTADEKPTVLPDDDLVTEALNAPGGMLSWALVGALSALKPNAGRGLPAELKPRFNKAAEGGGRPGLLARVYFATTLAYLDAIDPDWTSEALTSRLSWDQPEALPLWRAYAHGNMGSARLFNAVKPAMLEAFDRQHLSDSEFESIVSRLLSVCVWHRRGQALNYDLKPSEVKRALSIGPPAARRNVAWNLWRIMGGSDFEPADKAARWREIVGPVFRDIWPLDAKLKSQDSTRNLVQMALECDSAFPEAVAEIVDFLVPYELFQISHSLRLEQAHGELVAKYPLAFVQLMNALIDPTAFRIPGDLATVLEECVAPDPSVTRDAAYMRLHGLSRQRNA